ncbi:MAG TPA: LCP family protein [Acidimicrobiia bacterium]|nr:LCP family protein [Acidimicrobiia bacterium]
MTFLVMANLVALGLFWALNTGQNLLSGADTDEEVVDALTPPTGDALTFLVVGSDSREGLEDLANFGDFAGARGDVVMLVRVDPVNGEARMLSIPRDLWVDIPGQGKGKINSAYAYGGPSLMVRTIQENLGIEVNHYVEIGFVGFQEMVDELGGIHVSFPYAARDGSSGLDVEAGTEVLDGEMALAYARSRKYQEYRNGSWVSVDANDIGRTQRQQEVVRAILSELKTPASLASAGDLTSALASHMTIDATLASSSIAGLAWDFRSLLMGGIEGSTLPVDGATVGGASVVVAREPDATQMIAAFVTGSATAVQQPLRVQVLNGNGVSGAAGKMSETLQASGFTIESIGNAETRDYELTTIIVPVGSANGRVIVSELGFGVVEFGDVDNGYDAVVIVGADAS